MHHPNQKVADSMAGVSRNAKVLAITDTSRSLGVPMRSADCASCHSEHRGDDALMAKSDEHCLICHTSLASATKSGATTMPSSVTAFDATHHPAFGAHLLAVDAESGKSRLTDSANLKFNHRKHLGEVPELSALGDQSCVRCHEFSATEPRYAQPVSYERHCAECHQLAVPDSQAKVGEDAIAPIMTGIVVPHRPMNEVRAFLASRLLADFDRPDADFTIEDEDHKGTKQQLWLYANTKSYAENSGAKFDEATDPATLKGSWLIDQMTASASKTCLVCHTTTGNVPANVGEPITLATVRTGLPTTPRRWFADSTFDHRPHRDMTCVQCHGDFSSANLGRLVAGTPEPSVEQTSFVHVPNLTWTEFRKGGDGRVESIARSCVECHHPDTMASGRGASSACITCHNFHDRSAEQMPAIKTAAVAATQPTAMTAP